MNFNTKISFTFLSVLMLSVFAVSLVSAAETGSGLDLGGQMQNFIDGAVGVLSPVTSLLFGADKSTGDAGFVTLMAFLLTCLVVYGVLNPIKIFGENEWINGGIAVIVALIGARFIPVEMLRSFTLPSEGLVGALFLIIPFFIVGSLVMKAPANLRKVLWTVYAVILTALWMMRLNGTGFTMMDWVYMLLILACAAAFLFDDIVKKMQRTSVDRKDISASETTAVRKMKNRLEEVDERLANLVGRVDKDSNNEREDLIKEKRQIEKSLAKFESSRSA